MLNKFLGYVQQNLKFKLLFIVVQIWNCNFFKFFLIFNFFEKILGYKVLKCFGNVVERYAWFKTIYVYKQMSSRSFKNVTYKLFIYNS